MARVAGMVAAAGGDSRMGSVAAMSAQLKELRERAAASTAALRGMTAQGDEVEAMVQRKRSLKPLVAELRSEVRVPSVALSCVHVLRGARD